MSLSELDPLIKLIAVNEILIESISEGNSDIFNKFINLLPIGKVKPITSNKYLNTFLRTAMKYGQKEIVHHIFEAWKRVYPVIQEPSLFIVMFTESHFKDDLITYLIEVFEDVLYEEVILDLMKYENSDPTTYGCYRADRMYGIQKYAMYKRLHRHAVIWNENVSEYLIRKIKSVSPFASLPDHMIVRTPLPNVSEMTINENIKKLSKSVPVDVAFKMMMSGIGSMGLIPEEIKASVDSFYLNYSTASEKDKIDLVTPAYILSQRIKLTNDKSISMMLGPANAIYGSIGDDLKYGGDRMLIARTRDFIESEGRYEDWFTGACDECYFRIKYRWHAVRQPVIAGGWFGCFCSWKCCKTQVSKLINGDALLMIINVAEISTSAFGILERVQNPLRPKDVIYDSFLPLETIRPALSYFLS